MWEILEGIGGEHSIGEKLFIFISVDFNNLVNIHAYEYMGWSRQRRKHAVF